MITVDSQVPYDMAIYCWLHLHNEPLNRLADHSRRYEHAYLAWETVRKVRNPFFIKGTGFEGYFVGIHDSPEQMLDRLLEIGHALLDSNCRLYRYQYEFKARLMKTMMGELNDPEAIEVWASLLGATLGRLRCNLYTNDQNYRFQTETYWAVNLLPLIHYAEHGHDVKQHYALANSFNTKRGSKSAIDLQELNAADYEAGLVAWNIGRFGHPLIRAYLHEADRKNGWLA
jgi:hypothetical protein